MIREHDHERRRVRLTWASALAAAAAAAFLGCAAETPPLPIRNLDRPSSAAFACYGDLRVGGGDADAGGEVVVSAQPMAGCFPETPPPEDDAVVPPALFGFVLQASRGTVAVIDGATQGVLDSDPLTPGKNAIPITTLPVGLTADRSGCYMVTASASSCDLAALDVTSALDLDAAARIARYPITSADGTPMLAKPRAVIGGAQDKTIGNACPARPTGPIYVAYPGCHTVAVVDADSGQIQAGIRFAEDGSATVTDGAFECPQECGTGDVAVSPAFGPAPDGGPADAGPGAPDAGPSSVDGGAPRPGVITIGPDGNLYIGSENNSKLTFVELGEDGLPAVDGAGAPLQPTSVQLEGSVGVTAMAVTDGVIPGGNLASGTGGGTEHHYVYAVATDRTVRVVDLNYKPAGSEDARPTECDTEVDPRLVYVDEDINSNPTALSCLAVGDPGTPARRPGAVSPGIQMPFEETPLDVSFAVVRAAGDNPQPGPFVMSGTFAFVSTSRGNVYVVNVDDDIYPDFETSNPAEVNLALALPHQLRDLGSQRNVEPDGCGPVAADSLKLGPRLSDTPSRLYSTGRIAAEKLGLMPTLQQLECTSDAGSAPVPEMDYRAPAATREVVFPDWLAVHPEPQDWSVTYEGLLSLDSFAADIDGPQVRNGSLTVNGSDVKLNDPAGSFCQLGVEPYDAVQLIGCDPEQGDSQCGLNETCFVHPDAPSVVTSGICLPVDKADELAATCRDFLITRRQYSASDVFADHVTLIPRKRVLRTTPVDGCTDTAQCMMMAEVERTLSDPAHPIAPTPAPADAPVYDWQCKDEPSRGPGGPKRCVMHCDSSDDCEEGHTCLANYCYESTLPSQECVQAFQRYQVRASEAFVVTGTRDGYIHHWIADPDPEHGGQCMLDPAASPLEVGRIPLRPPPCVGDGMTDMSPNPCKKDDVDQPETYDVFTPSGGDCVADGTDQRVRKTTALRLQNPAFRLDLVDTTTRGDAMCNGDAAGDLPPFAAAYTGFAVNFTIVGGFGAMYIPFPAVPSFPIKIVPLPNGSMWVLDEGDNTSPGSGRVFSFVPTDPANAFAPAFTQ